MFSSRPGSPGSTTVRPNHSQNLSLILAQNYSHGLDHSASYSAFPELFLQTPRASTEIYIYSRSTDVKMIIQQIEFINKKWYTELTMNVTKYLFWLALSSVR